VLISPAGGAPDWAAGPAHGHRWVLAVAWEYVLPVAAPMPVMVALGRSCRRWLRWHHLHVWAMSTSQKRPHRARIIRQPAGGKHMELLHEAKQPWPAFGNRPQHPADGANHQHACRRAAQL